MRGRWTLRVRLQQWDAPSRDRVCVRLEAPPDLTVVGLRLWRTASGDRLFYLLAAVGWPNPESVGYLDNDVALKRGEFAEVKDFRVGVLNIGLFCPSGPSQCPLAGHSLLFQRVEMVLLGPGPATAEGAVTGSMLSPGPLAGTVDVRTRFSDRGGGVAAGGLVIDGLERVRVPIGGCAEPYTAPVPCPLNGEAVVPLDTKSLPTASTRLSCALSTPLATSRAWARSRSPSTIRHLHRRRSRFARARP